jgi:hypothetical protein
VAALVAVWSLGCSLESLLVLEGLLLLNRLDKCLLVHQLGERLLLVYDLKLHTGILLAWVNQL